VASVGSYSHRLGRGRVISFLIALLGEGSPSGAGGITPPGSGGVPYTNNGCPQLYACNDGNSSITETPLAAETAIDIMVKFW